MDIQITKIILLFSWLFEYIKQNAIKVMDLTRPEPEANTTCTQHDLKPSKTIKWREVFINLPTI